VQLLVFDQLFNRAHEDRKTTAGAIRLQEEDLVLHHGVSDKIEICEFHTAFLGPARKLGGAPEPTSDRLFPHFLLASIALTQLSCQQYSWRDSSSSAPSQAIRSFLPFSLLASRISTVSCLAAFAPFDTFRPKVAGKLLLQPLVSIVVIWHVYCL
jgi:hypothetical protein